MQAKSKQQALPAMFFVLKEVSKLNKT